MKNNEKNNENEMSEQEQAEQLKKLLDPEEQMKRYGSGIMQLHTPIRNGKDADGNPIEIKELRYNFRKLTGIEYAEAMDLDRKSESAYRITAVQALALFAAAAAKDTPGLDATDIRRGLDITDGQIGIQRATIFFVASARAAEKSILTE